MDTASLDIIVFNAMIFSFFSIVFRLFQAISRKTNKQASVMSQAEYHYRVNKLFTVKIECDKLESYHRFSHKVITDILCSIFRIDNSGNNIEVFYVYPVRQALIIYIQISNYGIDTSKLDLFVSILKIANDEEGPLCEQFKMEFNERLNLDIKQYNRDSGSREGGRQWMEIIGDRIKVFVMQQEIKLSVNANEVVSLPRIQSISPSPIANHQDNQYHE